MDATTRPVQLWYVVLMALALTASTAVFRPFGFLAQVLAGLVVLTCALVAWSWAGQQGRG